MKGKPKYKCGDNVSFTIGDKCYRGYVYIVDANGTWDDPSDVSYDIMIRDDDGDKCLCKHITESLVNYDV